MSARGTFTATQSFTARRTLTGSTLADVKDAVEILNSSKPLHVTTLTVPGQHREGPHRAILLWCHEECVTKSPSEQMEEEQTAVEEENRQERLLRIVNEKNRADRAAKRAAASSRAEFSMVKSEHDGDAVVRACKASINEQVNGQKRKVDWITLDESFEEQQAGAKQPATKPVAKVTVEPKNIRAGGSQEAPPEETEQVGKKVKKATKTKAKAAHQVEEPAETQGPAETNGEKQEKLEKVHERVHSIGAQLSITPSVPTSSTSNNIGAPNKANE